MNLAVNIAPTTGLLVLKRCLPSPLERFTLGPTKAIFTWVLVHNSAVDTNLPRYLVCKLPLAQDAAMPSPTTSNAISILVSTTLTPTIPTP